MIIIKFKKISVTDGKLKDYESMFDSQQSAFDFFSDLLDDKNVKAVELQRIDENLYGKNSNT